MCAIFLGKTERKNWFSCRCRLKIVEVKRNTQIWGHWNRMVLKKYCRCVYFTFVAWCCLLSHSSSRQGENLQLNENENENFMSYDTSALNPTVARLEREREEELENWPQNVMRWVISKTSLQAQKEPKKEVKKRRAITSSSFCSKRLLRTPPEGNKNVFCTQASA